MGRRMGADHKGWKGLLTLTLLAALVATMAVFLPGATGHSLPPLSRFAFAAALLLIASPVLQRLWQPPPPDRPRLATWLQGAALFATFWFLVVVILNDIGLPSARALPWLAVAAGFGALMAAMAARPRAPTDTPSSTPDPQPRIAAPVVLAAATAALALLPVMSGTAPVLFTLILAFALADRPLPRRATLTPPDSARLALAATALGTALLAAR